MAEEVGLQQMVAICAGWWVAYGVVRLVLPSRSKDFDNRVVSLLHVVVSLYLCGNSVQNWSRPLDGVGSPSTYSQMLAISVSLAYFIYDTICCLVELPFSMENLIHHVISVLGLGFGYLSRFSGTELVACLMLMEVSNPFMHGREMLKELNLKDSSISLINDVMFALVFTVARIGVGPFLVYYTAISPTTPFGVKFGAIGIQLISLLWFWKILRMLIYKLKKAKPRKAE